MNIVPEKLSLWDRWFNRYKKELHDRGSETWKHFGPNDVLYQYPIEYTRNWIEYKIIDRLTGGYTIKREYLT